MIINKKISLYTKISKIIDIKTMLITLALVVAGLICLYSAVINNLPDKFNMQLIWAIIGFFVMLGFARIPLNTIKDFSYIFYIIMVIALAGLFIVGTKNYGTTGWYSFGPFSFQPAEFTKIALILAVAKFLSTKGNSVANMLDIGKLIIMFAIPFGLILKQPDLGTALTLLVLFLGLLFWAGADPYYGVMMIASLIIFIASLMSFEAVLITGFITAIVLLFFKKKIYIYGISIIILISIGISSESIFSRLGDHQQSRILVFLYPDKDIQNTGYNLNQSKIAVGSGGLVGKGYMQGSINQNRYIPKHYNDFIYSVPSEEFGFLGSFLILLLLFILCYRGVHIAYQSKDIFSSLIAFSSSLILFIHIFYNIGMVLGLFPIMGIPLPFFSHGGTFLMSNFIYVSFIMNVHRSNNQ